MDIMDCSVENIYEVDGFRFPVSTVLQEQTEHKIEVLLSNAQNDKYEERGIFRKEGNEKKGN